VDALADHTEERMESGLGTGREGAIRLATQYRQSMIRVLYRSCVWSRERTRCSVLVGEGPEPTGRVLGSPATVSWPIWGAVCLAKFVLGQEVG
jgi:hypothetical protein